jgi:alpha-1,4-digalacturonate transport system permease protein
MTDLPTGIEPQSAPAASLLGNLRRAGGTALGAVFSVLRLADGPMRLTQRLIGERRMAYVFLLPNLAFFSLFVFVPLAIDLVYSFTGGESLFPSQRPYVGTDQYAYLFDCGSFFDPASCRVDHFWRGVANTLRFTVFQLVSMVTFSLVTALVLNMRIRGRGFFRAVYFFPVLLSPVVDALVWKWILQRDGLLNAALTTIGGQKILRRCGRSRTHHRPHRTARRRRVFLWQRARLAADHGATERSGAAGARRGSLPPFHPAHLHLFDAEGVAVRPGV